MRNNILPYSDVHISDIRIINPKKYFYLFSVILLLGITSLASSKINAQIVKQPLSEVTTSIKHYTYTYLISQTQKKDIEYIIIKASNGDIKTVFNACDVCYKSHKGYSQNGNELRCNNCGNRFKIDALGNEGPKGTCNPGYLPHTFDAENVIMNVSDLIKGEYFFLATTISSVNEESENNYLNSFQVFNWENNLIIKSPNDIKRDFSIVSLTGQLVSSFSSSSAELEKPIDNLSKGLYFLNIIEEKKVFCKYFWVY